MRGEVAGPLAWLRRPDPAQGLATGYLRAVRRDPCAYCGESAETLDHIQSRQDGGADGWENRAGICTRCNSRKHRRTVLSYLGGRWSPTPSVDDERGLTLISGPLGRYVRQRERQRQAGLPPVEADSF